MDFNKYFGIFLCLFAVLASDLRAQALSNDKLAQIIDVLEKHAVSPWQAQQIAAALKKNTKKRVLAEITNSAKQAGPKRIKTEAVISEGARAVVGTSFYCSPKKGGRFGVFIEERKMGDQVRNRKNAIYLLTAVKNHEDEYIEYQDRIDANAYFSNIKKLSLADALLDVETKIRNLIKKNNLLFKRTIYTGLAQDDSDRARAHKSHMKSSEGDQSGSDSSSRKIRWLDKVYARGMITRMSPIIENIPEEYMKHFEVLVGSLFNVTEKGSTTLGDEDAYQEVAKHRKSLVWKDHLSALGLLTTVEDLVMQEDDFTLGFNRE